MERKVPFIVEEHYHVYTRGVDKMVICKNDGDFKRLQLLLYLCNSAGPVNMRELFLRYKGEPFVNLYNHHRDDTLVDIAAYAIMPNHFHLLVKEKIENGISRFMLKLMTAYSMYFNTKYERSGSLFTRPFRSRHINTDKYLRWIFSYIHLNPMELHQNNWKELGLMNIEKAQVFMKQHPYGSFYDYFVASRMESRIIEKTVYQSNDLRTIDSLIEQLVDYKGEPFA